MDAFVAMLRAHRENVHPTLTFCYKIARVPLVSLAHKSIFCVGRMYVDILWDVRDALVITEQFQMQFQNDLRLGNWEFRTVWGVLEWVFDNHVFSGRSGGIQQNRLPFPKSVIPIQLFLCGEVILKPYLDLWMVL